MHFYFFWKWNIKKFWVHLGQVSTRAWAAMGWSKYWRLILNSMHLLTNSSDQTSNLQILFSPIFFQYYVICVLIFLNEKNPAFWTDKKFDFLFNWERGVNKIGENKIHSLIWWAQIFLFRLEKFNYLFLPKNGEIAR